MLDAGLTWGWPGRCAVQVHPTFSKVCVRIGRFVHNFSSQVNLRFMGLKLKEVKELQESIALSRGADFIGEVFIFSVGGSIVWVPFWPSVVFLSCCFGSGIGSNANRSGTKPPKQNGNASRRFCGRCGLRN